MKSDDCTSATYVLVDASGKPLALPAFVNYDDAERAAARAWQDGDEVYVAEQKEVAP